MPMKRCDHGHFYDTDKHTICPACGVSGLDIEATLARGATTDRHDLDVPTQPRESVAPTQARQGPARAAGGADAGVTVAHYKKSLGIDPVVGWLVCTAGPDKGRDFRIKNERNFIGRSPGMDICIGGDDGISRERHAVISFNPRKKTFLLLPGEAHGLVYHNDDEVIGSVELKPYDRIEMGQSTLLFVPFCGASFSWDAASP